MTRIQSPRLSDKVRLSNAALYERALHLFLSLYAVEGSPLASALGVSLFLQNNDLPGLEVIYEQLDREVGSLSNDPTDETDLPNKTLLLVAYHGLCQNQSFEENLPLKVVNDYLNFASREDWFGISEVAYFTFELARDMQVTEEALAYFRSNLRDWIHHRVVSSTCQGLHILREKISATEANSILDLFENQIIEELNLDDSAWVLIGLTALSTILTEPALQIRITALVDSVHSQLSAQIELALVRDETDVRFQGIVHVIQSGSATMDEIQSLIQRFNQGSHAVIKGVDVVEKGILLITDESIPDYSSRPALSSLALYLWSMYVSGHHQIIGVSANLKEEFQRFLSEGEAVIVDNAIVLPRMASIIINFMALLFLVGMVAVLILYGGNGVTINLASYDLRNVDLWTLFLTELALLVLGAVSIIRTGSMLHALRRLSNTWQGVGDLWSHKDSEK